MILDSKVFEILTKKGKIKNIFAEIVLSNSYYIKIFDSLIKMSPILKVRGKSFYNWSRYKVVAPCKKSTFLWRYEVNSLKNW